MTAKGNSFSRPDPDKTTKMSGKFDTDDFDPKVWSTLIANPQLLRHNSHPLIFQVNTSHSPNNNWFELLTCQKRLVRISDHRKGNPTPEILPPQGVVPDASLTSKKLLFPVAIVLTHPVHVFYGLPGDFFGEHRTWVVNDVDHKGIDKRCAKAALGAAWKGFGEGGIKWPATNAASFKFSAPYRTLGVNTDRPQDVTMLRDVTLWIYWDQWERKKLSLEQRTKVLNSWGYKCTPKAVKRVVEKILG